MSEHRVLDGWSPITCEQSNEMVYKHTHGELGVFASITDPEGEHGPPLVYTEWGIRDEDRPVLRNYLTYDYDGKMKKCTHYIKENNKERG